MKKKELGQFNIDHTIEHIKHYLPSQGALKDFIHHNTLHAFQDKLFFKGLNEAYEIFGYKVTLSLQEYQAEYKKGRITEKLIDAVLKDHFVTTQREEWKKKMLETTQLLEFQSRIGNIRENWKTRKSVDLDALVYPNLFKLLCSYLDQGISLWKFPINDLGFLEAIRELERNNFTSIFKKKRSQKLLFEKATTIFSLLDILVGDSSLYEHYLFDQQFEHQGWSGMVSEVEKTPTMMLDERKISTHDLILLECLMEIDALDSKLGEGKWKPLKNYLDYSPKPLFDAVRETEVFTLCKLWQEAYEWSYYNTVLLGIQNKPTSPQIGKKTFQAVMCIDDRECSWRQYIEHLDPNCETFGTPGFFGMDVYFQPHGGKFFTKICPAPLSPKHLIKEIHNSYTGTSETTHHKSDVHFSHNSYNSYFGWVFSQFIGFFSAFSLVRTIFKPSKSAATASAFNHMEKLDRLTIEFQDNKDEKSDLQIGFTLEEMTLRVSNTLKSIGLTQKFADIVYIIGHGASSTNNPYYAGYDCGACCGRSGSVNARGFSHIANLPAVRANLIKEGIIIPDSTIFMGGLHDTTQDVIQFFDKDVLLSQEMKATHIANKTLMRQALLLNTKERARRFETVNIKRDLTKIHNQVKLRAVSLFEPRPEYNHATNSLCIIGRREMTKSLFLDRRAFLNSYDYAQDSEGKYLLGILNAAAPVCGGINLEYYFSRTDNQKLGAGSKLPHNVMGLFGVANGIEGDLRPGLPQQMIEIHEPLRLLIIVEHFPEVVLKVIQTNPNTYEWFANEWINLTVWHPIEKQFYVFKKEGFTLLSLIGDKTESITVKALQTSFETQRNGIPVQLLNREQ